MLPLQLRAYRLGVTWHLITYFLEISENLVQAELGRNTLDDRNTLTTISLLTSDICEDLSVKFSSSNIPIKAGAPLFEPIWNSSSCIIFSVSSKLDAC